MTNILSSSTRRVSIAVAVAVALTGCTLEKQSSPTLSGPSTVALTLAVAASPDVLPRDGSSTSTITVSTRGADGQAVQQRVTLSTTAGTLSSTDVTTNSSGQATVLFTAPSLNTSATSATITAQPVDSTNALNKTSIAQTVKISLSGPGVPTPKFTASSTSPGQFDLVTFDASATTLNGTACGSSCTYVFDFGDNSNATGQSVTHRYSSQGTFIVTLTVTAPGGTTATTSQTITVGTAKTLTASFSMSPTDPHTGDTVHVDGTASTTPDGASISSYAWDFGCSTSGTPSCTVATATGSTATTVYNTARTYTIRLTITDSLGRTATTSQTLTVK